VHLSRVNVLIPTVLAGCLALILATALRDRSFTRHGADLHARQSTFDEPDAAQRLFEAKRRDPAGRIVTPEAYRLATARLARMPRFSSRSGRLLAPDAVSGRVWATAAVRRDAADALLDTWTPLGPGNIGGRSRVVLVHPQNPAVLFAAGVSGGVWQTRDAGASWRPIGESMANVAVNAMALSPRQPDVVYAGTGEGYFREDVRGTGLPLRGGGIFKTTDGGATWARLAATATPDFEWVNDLVVSAHDDRRVYAATRTGVWSSLDAGDTWTRLLDPAVRGGCLDLEIRRDRADDVLFASCGTFEQATVYRILDASGRREIQISLREPGMGRTSLAIAPSHPDVVYALAASNEPGPFGNGEQGLHGLYRSTAGGAPGTWAPRVTRSAPVRLHRLLLTNAIAAMLEECRAGTRNSITNMGWYTNVVAVDPRDPDIVWAGGVDWFRSNDGGLTWGLVSHWWTEETTPSFAHADQHGIAFHPGYDGEANQTAFIAGDGGIFRTDNARAAATVGALGPCNPRGSSVAWTSLNHGYGVTQFYHGVPFTDGRRLIGGTQDNGTIVGDVDAGFDGWRRVLGGDGGYVAVDPDDSNVIYAETQWGNLQKSMDGGQTFTPATSGMATPFGDALGPNGNYLFVAPFAMDPSDARTLWIGGQAIYRSRDGASGWTQASALLEDGGKVSAIAISPADGNRVAVGAWNGWVYHHAQATDANAGARWPASKPRDGWVTSVVFDPGNADVVYATYGSFGGPHVFRSVDAGTTWTSIDGTGETGLPDIPVHAIVVDPADSRRLYLATDLGVFVSTSRGGQWMTENTGFGPIVTESLSLLELDGQRWLYAFTHGRGAWRVIVR
jgi:photosystem II stability/assembly factor-like uncharacterized protein